MQLKKSRSIRNKLALASSALLISAPAHTVAKEAKKVSVEDSFSISQLYYDEKDRVSVEKTQAVITKEISEDDKVKLSFIYDTMSGASPNGRIYTVLGGEDGSITYTTASGTSNTVASNGGSGPVEAWKTSFKDTRKAYNAEWEHAIIPTLKAVIGGGLSTENDYESKTFSGKLLLDLNQRRTTLTGGFSVSLDTVDPFGGIPEGSATIVCHENAFFRPNWLDCDTPAQHYKPGDKVVNDYLIGITQVWNRRTLMQFNIAIGREDGYLTDPYKQVSIISSQLDKNEVAVLHEKRPDTRNTRSLYYKLVHIPTDKIALNSSYRLFWDDWGVLAHTFDARAILEPSAKIYFQIHARAHWQGAADFFQPYIGADSSTLYYEKNKPDIISADSRLGELANFTAGAKVGLKINKDASISGRIEQLTTRYDNKLLPTLKTFISQIILKINF